jgi:hypothetical protein
MLSLDLTRTRARHGRSLALTLGVIVATAALSACGDGGDASPLIRTAIKVQSITQSGSCEDVNIKAIPGVLLPNPSANANKGEFVTPVKLTKAADGVACAGEGTTIPMAPGKWTFKANLPSNVETCERDIPAAGGVTVSFKDGEASCN